MAVKNRVAVVTGGSAGLGRAIVHRLADEGAKVGIIARGRERLEAASRAVEARGGTALAMSLDVADAAAVDGAAERVENELGPIDIWVNNAMTSVFSPVHQMQADEYRRVTEVTYLGVVYGTLAALRHMRPRNRGVIIQVGSALAHRSIPLQSAYCAAKHAIKGFTESLRTELLHDRAGLRVTMVDMPALNTPQFEWVKSRLPNRAQPVPPIFQPEVGAEAVCYAVNHDCGPELLVGWPTLKAVVGEKVASGVLDHVLARTGYSAQQTGEPADDRPNNLWHPAPGDWGAHGRFDARARGFSVELWARTHRRWIAIGAAGALGLAAALLGADGTRSEPTASS